MYITKQQLFDIQCALELARYFCEEHDSGFQPEQNKRDYETYNDAMKALKDIKESEKANA